MLLRCLCLFCPRARLRSAELYVRSPSNILFCACYCGSVLLWRRCRTICTPCLVDFCTFTLVMTTNMRREKSITKSDSRGGGIASHVHSKLTQHKAAPDRGRVYSDVYDCCLITEKVKSSFLSPGGATLRRCEASLLQAVNVFRFSCSGFYQSPIAKIRK